MVLALFFLREPSVFFLRAPSFFFTTGSVAGTCAGTCGLERHTWDLCPKREQCEQRPQHSEARWPVRLQEVQILRGTSVVITGFAENVGVLLSRKASMAVILFISWRTSPH